MSRETELVDDPSRRYRNSLFQLHEGRTETRAAEACDAIRRGLARRFSSVCFQSESAKLNRIDVDSGAVKLQYPLY